MTLLSFSWTFRWTHDSIVLKQARWGRILMPQGDKYIHFTNYLKKCHEQGQDELTLSFTEIERIWGFPLARSMRKYSWGNDRTQSYALGWLYADFTVTTCDLSAETVTGSWSKPCFRYFLCDLSKWQDEKAVFVRHKILQSSQAWCLPHIRWLHQQDFAVLQGYRWVFKVYKWNAVGLSFLPCDIAWFSTVL